MKTEEIVEIDEEAFAEAETKATTFTLADAVREGFLNVRQTHGQWGDAENTACALTSVAISLRNRGII